MDSRHRMHTRNHYGAQPRRDTHGKDLSKNTQRFVDKVMGAGNVPGLGPHLDIGDLPKDMNELVAHTLLSVRESLGKTTKRARELMHEGEKIEAEYQQDVSSILQRAVVAFIATVGRESGTDFFATNSFAKAVRAFDPREPDTDSSGEEFTVRPDPGSQGEHGQRASSLDGSGDELEDWRQAVLHVGRHRAEQRGGAFSREGGFMEPNNDGDSAASNFSTRPSANGRQHVPRRRGPADWDAVSEMTVPRGGKHGFSVPPASSRHADLGRPGHGADHRRLRDPEHGFLLHGHGERPTRPAARSSPSDGSGGAGPPRAAAEPEPAAAPAAEGEGVDGGGAAARLHSWL